MRNTTSQIRDIQGADIWVMDPSVQFIDDITPLSDNDLYRVRSVPGVAWAVKLYKGMAAASFTKAISSSSSSSAWTTRRWSARRRSMLVGSLADLRRPDAVILDERGYQLPVSRPAAADRLEVRDERPPGAGGRHLQEFADVSRLSRSLTRATARPSYYAPQERRVLSFVLAQGEPGVPTEEVCRRIHERTGLMAMSQADSRGGRSPTTCSAPAFR